MKGFLRWLFNPSLVLLPKLGGFLFLAVRAFGSAWWGLDLCLWMGQYYDPCLVFFVAVPIVFMPLSVFLWSMAVQYQIWIEKEWSPVAKIAGSVGVFILPNVVYELAGLADRVLFLEPGGLLLRH